MICQIERKDFLNTVQIMFWIEAIFRTSRTVVESDNESAVQVENLSVLDRSSFTEHRQPSLYPDSGSPSRSPTSRSRN